MFGQTTKNTKITGKIEHIRHDRYYTNLYISFNDTYCEYTNYFKRNNLRYGEYKTIIDQYKISDKLII